MSLVEVVVPCHGYGHFLRGCVESVLSQNDVDVRVLIIDDTSPDDTALIATEMAAADDRVVFRRHEVNQGYLASYNEGLEWLSGDYALILDPDDLLTPGALARAAHLMNTHPEVGMTFGQAIITADPTAQAYAPPSEFKYQILSPSEWLRIFCANGQNVVSTPTAIVRTSLQKQLGGYRLDLPHTADMELWLRFGIHAPVAYLRARQAYYRLHEKNMHKDYLGIKDAVHRKAALDVIFREQHHRIDNCESYQRMANRGLARSALIDARKAFNDGEIGECRALAAFARELEPSLFQQEPLAEGLLLASPDGGFSVVAAPRYPSGVGRFLPAT